MMARHECKNATVTLVIVCFNQERYVEDAVTAGLSQLYSPLEVIISDDASTDRTYEIIQQLVGSYTGPHKVRLNKNDKNIGIVPHINKILTMVETEYVVVAAGDDVSFPTRVGSVLRIFREHGCSAVYASADKIDTAGTVIGHVQFNDGMIRRGNMMFRTPLYYGAGAAYSMSIVKRYGLIPDNVRNEDGNLMWKALFCDGLCYAKERMLSYRQHELNFTITRVAERTQGKEAKLRVAILDNQNKFRNYKHALRLSNIRWIPAILRGLTGALLRIVVLRIRLWRKVDNR